MTNSGSSDTLRLILTFAIAFLVLIGGGALLVVPSQIDPSNLLPFMTGIFNLVLGWVFIRETQSGAAKAAERAVAAGAASQSSPPTSTLPPPAAPAPAPDPTMTPPADGG